MQGKCNNMHDILTGKSSTVLHLSLNDREGTGSNRTQCGGWEEITPGFICEHKGEETYADIHLETTENI